jgi:hypothetical protein
MDKMITITRFACDRHGNNLDKEYEVFYPIFNQEDKITYLEAKKKLIKYNRFIKETVENFGNEIENVVNKYGSMVNIDKIKRGSE